MKQVIKDEINKLYSLFETIPKLNVKSTKQHIDTFADKPEHYKPKYPVTRLRAAVNSIVSIGKCAWCGASKEKVKEGFTSNLSREEYQISALCQKCQDNTFREEV
jgi:hypothetical protein